MAFPTFQSLKASLEAYNLKTVSTSNGSSVSIPVAKIENPDDPKNPYVLTIDIVSMDRLSEEVSQSTKVIQSNEAVWQKNASSIASLLESMSVVKDDVVKSTEATTEMAAEVKSVSEDVKTSTEAVSKLSTEMGNVWTAVQTSTSELTAVKADVAETKTAAVQSAALTTDLKTEQAALKASVDLYKPSVDWNRSVAVTSGNAYGAVKFRSSNFSQIPEIEFSDKDTMTDLTYMFYNCNKLENIDFKQLKRMFPAMADGTANCYFMFYSIVGPLTSVEIDTDLPCNCRNMFDSCSSLTNIHWSVPLTGNMNSMFSNVGSISSYSGFTDLVIDYDISGSATNMFSGCTSIKSVTINCDLTGSINGMFSGCTSIESIELNHDISGSATTMFSGCTSIKSVTINHDLTGILNTMFLNCTTLSSVSINHDISGSISGMFANCTALTSVTIDHDFSNNSAVYQALFNGCSKLTSVTVNYPLTGNLLYFFQYTPALSNIVFNKAPVGRISQLLGFANGLVNVVLSDIFPNDDTITCTADNLFYSCPNLVSVVIDRNFTSLVSDMFWNCAKLSTVTIKTDLTPSTWGNGLFRGDPVLTTATIDSPLQNSAIGYGFFNGISSLTTINVLQTVYQFPNVAGCTKLSKASMETIFSHLADLTGYKSSVLYLSKTAVIANYGSSYTTDSTWLAHIADATSKNWTVSVS